jgi:hypothetical protein
MVHGVGWGRSFHNSLLFRSREGEQVGPQPEQWADYRKAIKADAPTRGRDPAPAITRS